MKLYTSYQSSPLGQLRLQCSDDHITSVLFVEEDGNSEEHQLLQICSMQLREYFIGKRKEFDLPFKQHGTELQSKVWNILYQIPYGKTISYNDLAKKYGDLKAIRAVASANGKNNLAIIVPCHRVIGSNQALVGYAGGLSRKKWLLDHEARFHHGVQSMF